ncbi:MAG: hypothetical protein QOH39_1598 [Verrucomicrobiota bacterium]|jgi:hypothetical protein
MPNAIPIERQTRRGVPWKAFDLKLGYALLRDRRVRFRSKAASLAIGLGVLVLVGVLELPVEEIIAAVVPFAGVGGDLLLDGVEIIVGPLLVACLVLPYLTPSNVVAQIRRERAGIESSAEGPVIDV